MDLQKRSRETVEKSTAEAIRQLKEGGADVATLSASESARWREVAQPVWKAFAQQNGAAAQAMLDAATRLASAPK